MPHDPVHLDYAPPPAAGARRVRRRWLWIAFTLLALYAAARWLPDAASFVRLAWIQSRTSTFTYPPDTVIYDSDPARRAALLADPANYVPVDDATLWLAPATVRREPACWTDLKTTLFGQRQFWPPGPAAPKALVHRLRNGNGQERLVAVIVAPAVPGQLFPGRSVRFQPPGPNAPELGLVAAIIQPGDWDNPPRWDGNGTFLRANFDPARRLRFFAAHVDPADPARFSLRYEIDGQPGTVDGTYQTDGDVVMTVRDGPAKTTP